METTTQQIEQILEKAEFFTFDNPDNFCLRYKDETLEFDYTIKDGKDILEFYSLDEDFTPFELTDDQYKQMEKEIHTTAKYYFEDMNEETDPAKLYGCPNSFFI